MLRDPIVEEVREVRRKTEEACGHDWKKLLEHFRHIDPGQARIVQGQPKRRPPRPTDQSRGPQ